MRSITALKIIQVTMGLTGIILVALSIGYIGNLQGGLIQLLVSSPTISGLLTGLPLIPLIHSAKQSYTLVFYDELVVADFTGSAQTTSKNYEIPVAGWLMKTKTVVFQETAFDQDVAVNAAWHHDMDSITWDQGADNENILENMVEQWDASSVHEFQHTFPVHQFYINNAISDSDQGVLLQETKIGGPGIIYEQGENIYFTTASSSIGSNPTTGILNMVTEATFTVIAYDKRKRQTSETAPWVTIIGEPDSTSDSAFAWPVNTNMRVVNMRVTIWLGMDVDNQAFFVVDKNAQNYAITQSAIELHSEPFLKMIFPIQDATGGGVVHTPVVTQYARGPYYLKKGEALQFRHESINSFFLVQFQYIPDYGYTAEFRRRFESTNYTSDFQSQYLALFTVPYDMYITTVKGFVAIITDNNESDSVWNLDLIGLKNKNMIDNTDLLLTYSNANVDGNILGASNAAGQMPWTLQSIPIVIETVDTSTTSETVNNTTTAFRQSYAEAVADFYPQGAQIGFMFPDDAGSNISTLIIEMHIEGLNRIKTDNAGSNILDGYQVARMEAQI